MLPQSTPVQLPLAEQPLEEWRSVVGYEGFYEVSSLGRVRRSAPGRGTYVGKILKPVGTGSNGVYRGVSLSVNSDETRYTIHSLVAAAFLGPRPAGAEVNHVDTVKTNNRAENLEYLTSTEHKAYSTRMGQVARGERVKGSKLTAPQVLEIRALAGTMSPYAIAALYGVEYWCIYKVVKRIRWKHI